jgi:hypothetical protein
LCGSLSDRRSPWIVIKQVGHSLPGPGTRLSPRLFPSHYHDSTSVKRDHLDLW